MSAFFQIGCDPDDNVLCGVARPDRAVYFEQTLYFLSGSYLDAAPSSFPELVARGILYMHVRIGLMLPLAENVQFAVPFRVRTVKERTRLSDTTAKSIGSSVRSSLGLDCAEASTAAEHQI